MARDLNFFFKVFRVEADMTSSGSLFQYSMTRFVKKCLWISVRGYVFLSVKGSLCGGTSSLALRDLCAGVRLP